MKELTSNEWLQQANKNVQKMIAMKDEILNRKDITEDMRKILLKELKQTMDKYIVTFKDILNKE